MHILLIEDSAEAGAFVRRTLERSGHEVTWESDGVAGLAAFGRVEPDLCLLDLGLPRLPGIEVLDKIRERDSDTPIIVLTGGGTVQTAVESMRRGADDFLGKPISAAELDKAISLVCERRVASRCVESLRRELVASSEAGDRFIVGESAAMARVVEQARTAARSSATVLITGPSGTGKSHLAARMHQLSARADGPFVPVSAATLPADLVESELFGHVKGAFTGASSDRTGRFELARGGTIFLDEIGEMSLGLQPKLLRVLQSGEFEPLGATQPDSRVTDARVIAATNQDLDAAVREGRFREDLFFRLNVVQLRMPALEERREDIPLLVEHFGRRYSRIHERPIEGVEPGAMRWLQASDWPGNVRQLANATERAVVFAQGSMLTEEDFRFDREDHGAEHPRSTRASGDDTLVVLSSGVTIAEAERAVIEATLRHHRGNRERAARDLDVSLSTLYRRLREYGSAGD